MKLPTKTSEFRIVREMNYFTLEWKGKRNWHKVKYSSGDGGWTSWYVETFESIEKADEYVMNFRREGEIIKTL